jgi:hypothetical protein
VIVGSFYKSHIGNKIYLLTNLKKDIVYLKPVDCHDLIRIDDLSSLKLFYDKLE